VDVEITPEPTEAERKAILRALELELSDDPAAPQPWGRPGVVEAGHPRQHDRDE
jgi:hypothetical protein